MSCKPIRFHKTWWGYKSTHSRSGLSFPSQKTGDGIVKVIRPGAWHLGCKKGQGQGGEWLKSVYLQEAIRKAKFKDGKSNRQIASELGISRNTVKKIVTQARVTVPEYKRSKPIQAPVMGSFIPVIEAWLAADSRAPRKQQHTSKRIYDRLVEEYQFPGSERRVREVVAALREKPKEAYLPLAFEPGEMAQVDWIEDLRVVIAGKPCKVQVLNLVLNYSGAVYCEAFEHARQEAFFQGHANAFAFWGGVPGTLTYDNLKSAVQKILEGKNREENQRFVAFRSAYLFDSHFCNPARGNEKGRVENMVKFVERNLFTPIPQVDSLAELNVLLRKRCQMYLNHTQARQNETVAERLRQEQAHFLSLPKFPTECCRVIPVKVSKSSLVQFETNRYSVPTEYAYQTLHLKAFVERVTGVRNLGPVEGRDFYPKGHPLPYALKCYGCGQVACGKGESRNESQSIHRGANSPGLKRGRNRWQEGCRPAA